ncbi:uncharacterized protein LOC110458475 [Mizuhopecten yessoensis]|uniref:uncharacterized protein LOC110458475 n=1 Tax=Mizuhopecten yessoensis TaxID=6573 RepID=UPI000B45DB9C|nr:uncharacterized protein LOC110458475 [Mizuhopecten yessoensis]
MEVDARKACLCHDMKWRAKFHFITNRLHGKLQLEDLKRIPRIICACKIDTTGQVDSKEENIHKVLAERWAAISTEDITAAKSYFDHFIAEQDPCEEFHGFLKTFRDRLIQVKLLDDSQSSASRFLYILQQLLQSNRCSLLEPISTNPQTRKIHKEVIVLSALRQKDIGNFIGRKGVRLRKMAAKGSKIDIIFNTGTKNVEAHIVCSESGMHALKEKLEKEAIEIRKNRDTHEVAVEKYRRDKEEMARNENREDSDAEEDGDNTSVKQ